MSKILIVFLHGIGDCIMLTPSLRLLKRQNPGIKIGLIVSKKTKEIFDNNPYVDEIFTSSISPHYGWLPLYFIERIKLSKEISSIKKKFKPDKTFFIVPHSINLGFSLPIPGRLVNLLPFLYPIVRKENEILRICHLLKTGKDKRWPNDFYTEIFIDKKSLSDSANFLRKVRKKNRKIAVVHFESAAKNRSLRNEEKREVIGLLLKNNFKIITLFEPGLKHKDVYDIEPKTLMLSAAIIKKADLFLGIDSGPAHMACALNKPAIVISKRIPPELLYIKKKTSYLIKDYKPDKIEDGLRNFNKPGKSL